MSSMWNMRYDLSMRDRTVFDKGTEAAVNDVHNSTHTSNPYKHTYFKSLWTRGYNMSYQAIMRALQDLEEARKPNE